MPILEIILALGLIALGIVMIYYKNEKVFNQVLLIVGGIILALGGLGLLVETTRVMLAANKAKKDAKASAEEEKKEDAVEVDATTKDEKKEEVPALEQKKEEPKEVKDEKKDEPKDDGVIDVTPKDEKK
jgi:outer membrane biosynthesis protein TonB